MQNTAYGYVRVSTADQHTDRQMIALREKGIPEQKIYVDRQSGKDFDRPAWQLLRKKLRPGDTLFVKSIDRLGRNYDEIIEQWHFITRVKSADIVVLDIPLLDTRNGKDLIGTLIADLTLQLLSFIAHQERDFIRQRQREGIAAAKERGTVFGAPRKQPPDQFPQIAESWRRHEISARAAADLLNVSHPTFLKWVKG